MPDLDFHPLANLFPLIEGAEFDDLVADVRANGLREAVVLYQGKVLDGRNRYRACVAAEVEPRTVYFRPELEGEPLAFVVSKNLKRRHLNESQRAMVAARLANLQRGDNQHASIEATSTSQGTAAQTVNVGRSSVQRAHVVQERGTPALVRAVDQGYLPVSEAAKAAKLAPAEQEKVAELATAGRANVARTVIKQEAREHREAELGARQAEGNLALPQKRYGVILADPAWRFETFSRETGMDRAADNHYPTSPTEEIERLDVASVAAKDCVLFLWATVPMLPDALRVMKAWGFEYKSHCIWRKDRVGTGYWFRNAHELLLVGVRGSVPAPAPGTREISVTDAPVGEHSVKPDIFMEYIENWYPTLPKIELNARRARPGWKAWGLDAPVEDTSCEESRERQTPELHSDGSKPEASPMGAKPKGTIGNSGDDLKLRAEPQPNDDGLDIPKFLRRERTP